MPKQVRCDAASLGVPCTNCVAFQIECKIPQPKRKKTQANTARDSDRSVDMRTPDLRSRLASPSPYHRELTPYPIK